MIIDNIKNLSFYRKKFPFLKNACDFLENGFLESFEGRRGRRKYFCFNRNFATETSKNLKSIKIMLICSI
jgi:hypothetical protein